MSLIPILTLADELYGFVVTSSNCLFRVKQQPSTFKFTGDSPETKEIYYVGDKLNKTLPEKYSSCKLLNELWPVWLSLNKEDSMLKNLSISYNE